MNNKNIHDLVKENILFFLVIVAGCVSFVNILIATFFWSTIMFFCYCNLLSKKQFFFIFISSLWFTLFSIPTFTIVNQGAYVKILGLFIFMH